MNNVSITGRLVRDVELKYTTAKLAVVSFTVAVDRPNSKEKVSDFIDCVAWRNTAEFISKYFHKGNGIEIQGILTTRSYDTKDGQKRKAVEVLCSNVSFPKGNSGERKQEAADVQMETLYVDKTAKKKDPPLPYDDFDLNYSDDNDTHIPF